MNLRPGMLIKHKQMKDVAFQITSIVTEVSNDSEIGLSGYWFRLKSDGPHLLAGPDKIRVRVINLGDWVEVPTDGL